MEKVKNMERMTSFQKTETWLSISRRNEDLLASIPSIFHIPWFIATSYFGM